MASGSTSQATEIVKRLLKWETSTPADTSFKHLVKLMNNYVKYAQDKQSSVSSLLEVLEQICAATKIHLDSRSTMSLKSVESVSSEEFVKSDGMKICRSFLDCVMEKSRSSTETDQDHMALLFLARYSLYKLLVTMTDTCDTTVVKEIIDLGILRYVAEDIYRCRRQHFEIFTQAGADKLNSVGPLIGLSLMENCANVADLPPKLAEKINGNMLLYCFADADENDIAIVILAISLIHNISPHNTIYKNLFTKTVFRNIAKYLKSAVLDHIYDRFRFPIEEAIIPVFGIHQRINLSSLLNCLLTLVISDDYKCHTIQTLRTYVPKLDEILKEGNKYEKEQLVHLFRKLCQHSCSKCSWNYLGDLLLKHGILPHDDRSPPPDYEPPAMKGGRFPCHQMELCHFFLKQLDKEENLLDQFMDQEFHRCFCDPCMNSRKDKELYQRGQPPQTYALPRGWTKFALKVPPRATQWNMFDMWNMAFYGTTKEELLEIFRNENLEMRGGDGRERMAVSPSIIYASRRNHEISCTNTKGERIFKGKVAFQVRVHPKSYDICPAEKTSHDKPIDPNFKNEELVWLSKYRTNHLIVIAGILVHAYEETGKK